MGNEKKAVKNIKNIERKSIIFIAVILCLLTCIAAFLSFYFGSFLKPYMEREIIDLSENWQYHTDQSELMPLDSLKTGPMLEGGETLTLYKTLDVKLHDAAIMIRANHQYVNVYLDGLPLFLDGTPDTNQNPGMALHFIPLPENYADKTLKIEITSPYKLYAGRTGSVLLGTMQSLEAYTIARSMRSVIIMTVCLALGVCTIVITLIQALKGFVYRKYLAVGVFAVIWALYYTCTEYIMFQFFTPIQMSVFSLGFYFSFQAPLTLFFYFSFEHYKKRMLPAVIAHCGFVAAALMLQLTGLMDLPRLLNVNNILLAGLIYTVVLTVLEAAKKNRLMMLAAPFLIIAYLSMLYNFSVFYTRRGIVPYSYRDTYFLLVLAILIYNVWQFLNDAYRNQRENEVLSLQNRLAKDNYEQIKTHLRQVGSLKHEMKNHLTAIKTYLENGHYDKAHNYLISYAGQAAAATEVVYHENFLVNAILVNFLQEAGNAGVKVELDLKFGHINISEPDLYSLLSNILENALEACSSISEGRERFIKLSIKRGGLYLSILCENSRTGEIINKDGKILTKKADSGHGYGLWIIEHIVDAYDGFIDIHYDENTFTVAVALKDL